MSTFYDSIKSWVDQTFGSMHDTLAQAISYVHQITFGDGAVSIMTKYMAWINYFPPAWKAVIVSLISSLEMLVAFYGSWAVFLLYLKIKEGIKWW